MREEAKSYQKDWQDKSGLRGEPETISTNSSTSQDEEKQRVVQKSNKVPMQSGFTNDNKRASNSLCGKESHLLKSDKKIQDFEKPSANPIVIDQALEQILNNDSALINCNLNNKEISQEILLRFADALCANTHVQIFSLANTHADDKVAFAIAKMLSKNSSIQNLNIESNFVSGQGILSILGALQQNGSLIELRFHNQRHICGGKVEMEMVQLLRENTSLLKLGYQFELPGPRMAATGILTRNQDQQRRKRLQEKKTLSEQDTTKVPKPLEENKKILQSPKKVPTSSNQEVPTRKIAEMVKQREVSSQTQSKKVKTMNQKNGANEKEGVDILKELRNSLKPSAKTRDEESKRPLPQRNGRDDLMAAIRESSIFSLKRVDMAEI